MRTPSDPAIIPWPGIEIRPESASTTVSISTTSLNMESSGHSFTIMVDSIVDGEGNSHEPALLSPAYSSKISTLSLGEVVLQKSNSDPGCDSGSEDGIWETLEDRQPMGGGSVKLRFNEPSDGFCETRDGNRQDLIAVLRGARDGEDAAICIKADHPGVGVPVQGCGAVSVVNRRSR